MNFRIQLLSIALCICAFSCKAKDTKDLIHYQVYNPHKNASIHVITVDPTQVNIVAVRAHDVGQGLMTVGNLARHFAALAAVNGGFFRVDEQLPVNGVPAGVLKINNYWHGISYKPRGAIAWQPQSKTALIDIIETNSKVILNDQSWPINAMNKLVSGNRAALLSDSYTDQINVHDNLNLVILDQHIQAVYDTGTISVPTDGYVYSLSGNFNKKLQTVRPGDAAVIDIKVQPRLDRRNVKQWQKMAFIVGGGPVLIHQGRQQLDFSQEHLDADFIMGQHARTAVGILEDKRWVFVVAERSLLEDINGISIPELRDFMHKLGCVAAVNLDGGGSTSMYIEAKKNGSIMDQPVADAIMILPKD